MVRLKPPSNEKIYRLSMPIYANKIIIKRLDRFATEKELSWTPFQFSIFRECNQEVLK